MTIDWNTIGRTAAGWADAAGSPPTVGARWPIDAQPASAAAKVAASIHADLGCDMHVLASGAPSHACVGGLPGDTRSRKRERGTRHYVRHQCASDPKNSCIRSLRPTRWAR